MESRERSNILRALAAIVSLALFLDSVYQLIQPGIPAAAGLFWLSGSFSFACLALLAFTAWYEKQTGNRIRILTGSDRAGKLFHLSAVLIFATIIGGILVPEGKLIRMGFPDIFFTVFFLVTITLMLSLLLFRIFRPYTDEELKNPKTEIMVLPVPFPEAFDLSRQAILDLGSFEISSQDPVSGTIIAQEHPYIPTILHRASECEATITVRRVDATSTAVVVHCISLVPDLRNRIPSPSPPDVVRKIELYLKARSRLDLPASRVADMALPDRPPVVPAIQDSRSVQEMAGTGRESCAINPVLPAVLSLLIPGLGQNLNGQFWKGITILVAVCVGILHFVILGIVIWIFSVYDAWMTANKMKEHALSSRPFSLPRMLLHLGAVIAAGWIMILVISQYGIARLLSGI